MAEPQPFIGITTYPRDDRRRFGVQAAYVEAVRRAGGVPVLLPPGEEAIAALVAQLDGFILAGGGDVEPALYGGEAHPEVYRVDAERDAFELALARALVAEGVPALPICRGCQVLNVALGGTLHEHLPDAVGVSLTHREATPEGEERHPVAVEPGSRLAAVLGTMRPVPVSSHHQAPDRVAAPLRVAARAEDGTIEALELPGHPFLLAVQWHPEVSAAEDASQQRLFDALVAAARLRAASRGDIAVTAAPTGRQTMRLAGKVALITGAGSGIGRASALLFAREGAAVVVVDVTDAAGEETVAMVRDAGGRALHVHADVSRDADCAAMVGAAEEGFGRLDVLFNNAGIMHGRDDDAVTTDEEVWDLTMAINAKGVFLGCKHGVPALRRAGGGSIVNTASFVAVLGAATPQVAYTASKGAVLAMTRELAVVHAREGIRVNALCPGPLQTKLLMDFLDTEAKKQRRLVHVPMGRFGLAEEMAKAALFLASDESSYMTGATFLVDGGITAAYVTPE